MDKTKTFLILKYGSTHKAMVYWLNDTGLHPAEDEILTAYSKLYWPNLNLKKIQRG